MNKTAAVTHYRHRGGDVSAFITSQDRSFATATGCDQSHAIRFGHVGVATLDERFGSDVVGSPIGVGCDDPHLLSASQLLDDRVNRINLNTSDSRTFQVELGSVGNPVAN